MLVDEGNNVRPGAETVWIDWVGRRVGETEDGRVNWTAVPARTERRCDREGGDLRYRKV